MMSTKIILFVVLNIFQEIAAFQPEFLESIANVSVPVGRDATFTCHVRRLGGYRVGWLKADTKAIQAIHENVITHNSRVTVSHLDQNTWNLHIRAVTEEDRGGYMCQLNTDPMKSQIGYLDVVIPPDFVTEDTSSDVIVPEGSAVRLTCRARGYPEPIVTWRREDGNEIVLKDSVGTKTLVSSYRGEVLKLAKISRNEMGSYLCIASNGVPPSVSKRISLSIHFHPVIQVPNQLVGAPLGTDVQIECHVEAFPKSINYWIKDSGEMIVSSLKYHVQEVSKSMYETKMTLIVKKFQKDDVGSYRCIAKNSLGEVDSSIRLYEIPGPSRKTPVNKHGGGNTDADTNDILKQKQLRVTYQPDDEDLYGSAEDFDDSDLPLPPLTPNVYYTSGVGGGGGDGASNGAGGSGNANGAGSNSVNGNHKHSTHKPGMAGGAEGGGRHHYNTMGNSFEYGITTGGTGVNGGAGGGGVGGLNGLPGVIGSSNAVTRKPIFYGKTDVRGGISMDSNDITSKASSLLSKMSISRHAIVSGWHWRHWSWIWWWCGFYCCCWPFHYHHWPYLIVSLSVLYSLITATTRATTSIFFCNLL
ncbi:dpr-interacting protein alpha [Haematobia irritans]|uniref:dpr-interacting protein alpha n=1 Tax=Haematobia irritans TaxID=7368 RepID=UPI003F4F7D14